MDGSDYSNWVIYVQPWVFIPNNYFTNIVLYHTLWRDPISWDFSTGVVDLCMVKIPNYINVLHLFVLISFRFYNFRGYFLLCNIFFSISVNSYCYITVVTHHWPLNCMHFSLSLSPLWVFGNERKNIDKTYSKPEYGF